MKLKFEITIAKVECSEFGPYEYKISLDSMVQQLFDTDTFEICGEGLFSLGVLSKDSELGGVRFPMGLLKGCKSVWLPISLPYVELKSISGEVVGPKVLLSVTEFSMLSPVMEHREASESSPVQEPAVSNKDAFIQCLEAELQWKERQFNKLRNAYNACELESKDWGQIIDQLKTAFIDFQKNSSKEEEELLRNIETLQLVSQQQEAPPSPEEPEDVASLLIKLAESEEKRKELQRNLMNIDLQPAPTNSSTQVFLEKENACLLGRIQELTDSLKESEENLLALTTCTNKESKNEYLHAQVHSLQKRLSVAKSEKERINKSLNSLNEENAHCKEVIEYLKVELDKQENEHVELNEQLKATRTPMFRYDKKDLDRLLKEYMQATGIKNPFIKVAEGVYSIKNRKVNLSLKNGVPVIRVGGGYLFIEEFIKEYLNQSKNDSSFSDSSPPRGLHENVQSRTRVKSASKLARTPSRENINLGKVMKTPNHF